MTTTTKPMTKLQKLRARTVPLLAGDYTGMRFDYSDLLMQASNALATGCKEPKPVLSAMLRQLQGNMTNLGLRWYAGDTDVVDELLQLYCVAEMSRDLLAKMSTPARNQDEKNNKGTL